MVTLAVAAAAVVVAYVLGTIVSIVVRRAGRRNEFVRDVSHRMRRPLRAVLIVLALLVALRVTTSDADGWTAGAEHLLLIVGIGVGAWFVGALAFVVEDSVLKQFRTDVVDNRHARRVRTQIVVVRRVTVALVVICAIAAMLFTFPAARTAGTSLLASAGLISIVAGLAAQTALANVFAGMQIAFTDAIRVDDVVVLEGEWGRIEEITMTYVVVHLWDDRRLIMPCTYFTNTPFQNWTRRAAELLGTVEIDLDWDVPVPAMRAELKRLLEASPLWDKRVGILQVTDATNGYVRMRALASAADAGTLFDLRCYVREGLVDWLQRAAPQGMPHTRLSTSDGKVRAALEAAPGDAPAHDLAKSPVRSGVLDSLFDEERYGNERDKPSVTAEPDLPRRIAARSTRPGVRMHLSEPARGFHTAPAVPSSEDETTLLGKVGADGTPVDVVVEPSEDATMAWGTSEGLFTGSEAAVERSKAFSGPGQEVIDERERTALLDAVDDEGTDGTTEGDSDDDEAPAERERRFAGHPSAGSAAAEQAVPEEDGATAEAEAAAEPAAAVSAEPAAPGGDASVESDRVLGATDVRASGGDGASHDDQVGRDDRNAGGEETTVVGSEGPGAPEPSERSGATRVQPPLPVPPPPADVPSAAPRRALVEDESAAPVPGAQAPEEPPSVTRTGVLRRTPRAGAHTEAPEPEQTARLPRVTEDLPPGATEETTRIPRVDDDGEPRTS
ncbi:small-conductance mechanosensitive channel [Sanguibacter keddieii DSM 10542]|uniref:Small-conductance mechanosensitive channel n=1 Tax=Sanguibacter keddieii (strain ATCC 51767 / DSM 10542 / NCFB 3025 / ST-74) TaxID=446469 RepID=D1BEJ6_SANKS|nr:small-conductance mechanosensitive channel [Sanguibacter keddieii DSM 10542]